MRNNDLGNRIVPRDVIVWEGLLGIISDNKVAKNEEKMRKRGKWSRAVACYEINEMLARKIWDLTWRGGMEIDLLTYLGNEFAEALRVRMDAEHMPLSRVWYEDPFVLARRLALTPDIRTVYDPMPEHQFVFGGKGRILLPSQFNLLGA